MHEAARSTGAWVVLAGHPLHASALVDLSCWPHGSEGSTGPLHPCLSMSQPRLSVVRGCHVLEPVECEVRSRRCFPELGGQGCSAHLHPRSPAHHLWQSGTRQEGSKLCVGTCALKGCCDKESFPVPSCSSMKKKLLFFSKETDSDHLTVGNYSNSEDAST